METYMISFLLVIVLHSALRITHVKGQSLRLQGSPPFAVRNETFLFTCSVTGSGFLKGGLSFQTVTGRSLNALCFVTAGTCREFSTLPRYTCECVSGQTRVFYLNITSVSTDDEGTWRCQYGAINSNTISLDVLYAPAITTVPTNKNVTENARPDIDCSSNITPGNPSTTRYRWTGPGEYSKDGAVLDRLVKRNQGGMYTCTATNTEGLSDTAQANINVQYAPVIADLPPNNNVIENASPDIDCSSNITPGNPSTTRFRWTGPGEYSKDGAVLDRLVKRNQGGMYTCSATNNAGLSDTAKVNINVQYAPTIVYVRPETNVTENASPDIDCGSNITPGNPSMTSYRRTGPGGYSKDGAALDNRLVNRNQGRMYTCTATNTAGLSDTAQANIDIQYRPERNVQKAFRPTITRQINDTAAMMATAAANPLPHFTWWSYDNGHLENIDDATDYTVFSSDLRTVLIVRIVHSRDYGTYVLRMNNSYGESILLYTLSQARSATGQSQPDRLGQVIGIGVGVSLPVVLVLVVIIVLMWRRNHQNSETVNEDQTETIEIQSQGHSTPNQDGAYASLDEHAPQDNVYEKLDMANTDQECSEPAGMVENETEYQNQLTKMKTTIYVHSCNNMAKKKVHTACQLILAEQHYEGGNERAELE
ncbi:B-cell receptor CD22-like [Haliotis cracherodii]|uniref:B-cell receptor CD22-like n=1 Tax=Haliotis cracherodii TaxID=6455 RepID=UPI0039E8B8B8